MISAQIVADSVATNSGIRITTMALVYPKYAHGELMTHRVFSRNARSSRAVPVAKILQEVQNHPVEPIIWLKNKPGMQGGDPMSREEAQAACNVWRKLASDVAQGCEILGSSNGYNLHKQWANRPLEAFSNIFTLVTSTYWKNFYGLRRHKDAQPEMKALADAMYEAHKNSVPALVEPGEWHLPYIDESAIEAVRNFAYDNDNKLWMSSSESGIQKLVLRVSVARCARVSYRTFENKTPTVEEDLTLFNRLVGSQPLHASPCEHQATPDTGGPRWPNVGKPENWDSSDDWGNFFGWRQFRKMLKGEDGADFTCDIPGVL